MDAQQPLLEAFPPVATEAWEDAIRADLRGADYDKTLLWRTLDGFDLRPYYRAEDLASLHHDPTVIATLRPAGTQGWRIRADFDARDVAAAAALIQQSVEGGVTDVGVRFSRNAGAPADVLNALLEGVDLRQTGLHLRTNGRPAALLDALVALASGRGIEPALLAGSLEADVTATLAGTGVWNDGAVDALADLLRDPKGLSPRFKLITADAGPYHLSGASLSQETGCLLAAASEYLARLTDAGIPPERVAERMQFVVHVGSSYFPEIARLRALRLLWAQLFSAYAPEAEPVAVQIQAVTSAWNQTVYDPHVNLLRATTEAASAVLGGCDVLTVRPHDEPLHPADAFGLRLARNIQLLLKHESAFDRVNDPGAGSYYLEVLTDKLGEAAWTFFQEIEAKGGLVAALEQGFVQERIAQTRQQREKELRSRRRVLVGTNNYPDTGEKRLADLAPAASGTPDEPSAGPLRAEPLPAQRAAEAFEALRLDTERHAARTGHTPTVFLLPIGHPAMRTARATFATNFFGCAGFVLQDHVGFESIEAGVEAVRAEQPDIVVLCSSDEEYPALAPQLTAQLKAAGLAPIVVIAGPPDGLEALKEAGVDDFVHRRSPLLETLRQFQQRLGIVA